jgi:uncharacterized protein (TIGR03437 family)
VAVSAPTTKGNVGTRLYPVPANLVPLEDRDFGATARSTVEYVLTAAASIQKDFVNDNLFLPDGEFQQLMYKDPAFQGMYSLWFTNPVLFAVGAATLTGSIPWSSFVHEMGHNFTLNTPSSFYYGGRIDGNANALFSESMAQIFQHATLRELAVNANLYGLDDVLVFDIESSGVASIQNVRASYERYVSAGKRFSSWNDSASPQDETFDTFMTVAYTFLKHAETDNMGYRAPLKRMLEFLQLFNSAWQQQYGQNRNDAPSAAFRATLMTAALSHAFQRDMREELRGLNFPIDNAVYASLSDGGTAVFAFAPSSVVLGPEGTTRTIEVTTAALDAAWVAQSDQNWLAITAGSAGRGPRTLRYSVAANTSAQNRTATIKIGRASVSVIQLAAGRLPLSTVSAASFARGGPAAPEAIVSGYGEDLASGIQVASEQPLPTELSGVTVRVRDNAGVERPAPLFFVSPGQINYLVPGTTSIGPATVVVWRQGQPAAVGTLQVDTVAPGIFSANSSGEGVAAALAVWGANWQYVFQCGSTLGSCVTTPLDLGGDTDVMFLQLYGTGIRGRSSLQAASAKIGGIDAGLEYAGPVSGLVGLDQVNLRVPRNLRGRGDVDVVLTVDGKVANAVKVNIR